MDLLHSLSSILTNVCIKSVFYWCWRGSRFRDLVCFSVNISAIYIMHSCWRLNTKSLRSAWFAETDLFHTYTIKHPGTKFEQNTMSPIRTKTACYVCVLDLVKPDKSTLYILCEYIINTMHVWICVNGAYGSLRIYAKSIFCVIFFCIDQTWCHTTAFLVPRRAKTLLAMFAPECVCVRFENEALIASVLYVYLDVCVCLSQRRIIILKGNSKSYCI